jgi:hypothetical protein
MTDPLENAVNELSDRLNESDGSKPVTPPKTWNASGDVHADAATVNITKWDDYTE